MVESAIHVKIINIISKFCAAVSNARMYRGDHPLTARYCEKTYSELNGLLYTTDPVTIFLVDGELVAGDTPLPSVGALVEKFSRILQEKGIERISFTKGLSFPEFFEFVKELASSELDSIQSRPNIKLGKVEIRLKGTAEPRRGALVQDDTRGIMESLEHLRDSELDKIKELYSLMRQFGTADAGAVEEAVRGFINAFRQNMNPISLLASVKTSDEYTFTHVINVGILTIAQAARLGFTGKQLHDIGIASMLHDVGKMFVPKEILDKPGKLSPEEWTIMQKHTLEGGRYLLGLKNIPEVAVLGAVEHHLRFDGSGYPFLQKGWKPSIAAQLISISDMFDALRSRRVYSDPKPMEQILSILMKERGTNFNPVLVDNFIELVATEKHTTKS